MKAGDLAGEILTTAIVALRRDRPVEQKDIFIEHRLPGSGQRFRFQVLGVELAEDGSILILADGKQITGGR